MFMALLNRDNRLKYSSRQLFYDFIQEKKKRQLSLSLQQQEVYEQSSHHSMSFDLAYKHITQGLLVISRYKTIKYM